MFDSNYTSVNWLESNEAYRSWEKIGDNFRLRDYIISAKFYDSDHVTAGETDTDLCLKMLLGEDFERIKRIAILLNAPTDGQFGYIRLHYEKDKRTDYTTIVIKPFPYASIPTG